jgi:dihydrofolate reductase
MNVEHSKMDNEQITPQINIIVAVDNAYGIGKNNDLLYSFPSDLKRFKALTSGHTIVMGRKTWESLPKKLPNREHVVLSRSDVPGADVTASSVESVLEMAGGKTVWVIGGAQIYRQFIPHADNLYLTLIEDTRDNDTDVQFIKEHLPGFETASTETLEEIDRISGEVRTIHFINYKRKAKD